jgi:hypothetical protein
MEGHVGREETADRRPEKPLRNGRHSGLRRVEGTGEALGK